MYRNHKYSINMHKMYLALKNLQWLLCHKTQPNNSLMYKQILDTVCPFCWIFFRKAILKTVYQIRYVFSDLISLKCNVKVFFVSVINAANWETYHNVLLTFDFSILQAIRFCPSILSAAIKHEAILTRREIFRSLKMVKKSVK